MIQTQAAPLRYGIGRFPGSLAVASLGILSFLCGCASEHDRTGSRPGGPFVVVGVDGADWKVIRSMWETGKLPGLRRLAERGVQAELRTDYGQSPVIWTTIVTGVAPGEHGITDFLIPGSEQKAPAASFHRRVPAIWNMASSAGLRVAVLGWWATWPAEEIRGVLVSDRVTQLLPRRVWPEEYLPRVMERLEPAGAERPSLRATDRIARQDRLMARLAPELVREDFDLLLLYLRSVDIASHAYWHYWDSPEQVDPVWLESFGNRVPEAYSAVDAAIGSILEAAAPATNFLVLSDHGFESRPGRPTDGHALSVDMDAVLEELGYTVRSGETVDRAQSRAWTHLNTGDRIDLRFGQIARGDPSFPATLAEDLSRVTYVTGAPVFEVPGLTAPDSRKEAGLSVRVLQVGSAPDLRVGGQVLEGAVRQVGVSTGTHGKTTHGIVIAAGPDIDPTAQADGIGLHDVAPTLLYGLGLSVARDFAGRAWTELFDSEFRARADLRVIPTWGEMGPTEELRSARDQELLDELRALGYID